MIEQWFSMCVFIPIFGSRIIGKANLKSKACYVKEFKHPNENNWLNLCVGRDLVVNAFLNKLYINSENWNNKYKKP